MEEKITSSVNNEQRVKVSDLSNWNWFMRC